MRHKWTISYHCGKSLFLTQSSNMLLSLADNSEVKEEIVAGYGEAEDLWMMKKSMILEEISVSH